MALNHTKFGKVLEFLLFIFDSAAFHFCDTLFFCRLPKLYICEYCLKYMKSRSVLQRHMVSKIFSLVSTTVYSLPLNELPKIDPFNSVSTLSKRCSHQENFTPHFLYRKNGVCRSIRLWVLVRAVLEPPEQGGSNIYPQSVLSKNKKNIEQFLMKF